MKRALGSLIVLPFLLIACDQQPPTTADLESELCTNLDQLGTTLTELSQINAQSSINELQDARQNVANAYQSVRDSATAVEASRVSDLETAYNNLDNTVNSISGQDTIGDAANNVAAAVADLRAARDQIDAEVTCP